MNYWRTKIFLLFLLFLVPYRAEALSVSPSINEIKIQAGVVNISELIIENNSDQISSILLGIKEFRSSERPGVPEFIDDENNEKTKWLSVSPRSFVLGAGEKQKVKVMIAIPASTKPGGYYLSVFATSDPKQQDGTMVTARQSVAVLYLLTVEGSITREATISKFKVKNSFFHFFPAKVTFLIENTGSIHIQPHGQIRINALFSPFIRTFQLNQENVRVLPNSTREIITEWTGEDSVWWSSLNPFRFGIYDAELFFDDMKLHGVLTTRFIIVSPTGILMLLAVGFWLFFKVRKRL